MITAADITDEACRFVVSLMPDRQALLDGALSATEPHRNHSRHELAKLWNALACTSCTLQYLGGNHPPGCIFVGWGHGWQTCSSCGGSGLSPMGDDLRARAAKESTPPPLQIQATIKELRHATRPAQRTSYEHALQALAEMVERTIAAIDDDARRLLTAQQRALIDELRAAVPMGDVQ